MSKILLTSQSIIYSISHILNLSVEEISKGIEEDSIINIESMILSDIDNIEELRYFQSLKSLIIKKESMTSKPTLNHSIIISDLPALEELTIENIAGLESIHIHNCMSLKKLHISNNIHLKKLIGINLLPKLSSLYITGCNLNNIDDLIKLMTKDNSVKFYIDSYLLPLLYKVKDEMNIEIFHWVESGVFSNNVLIDFNQGKELYDYIKQKSQDYFSNDSHDYENITNLYHWLCDEFSFDSQLHIKRTISSDNEMIITKMNDNDVSSSAYHLMKNKYGGTDAFIHLLHLILSMNGYNVSDVMCCIPNDFNKKYLINKGYTSINRCNHLLLRIETNAGWLYLDPVIDSIHKDKTIRKVFQSKHDIMKEYFLINNEESISSPTYNQAKDIQSIVFLNKLKKEHKAKEQIKDDYNKNETTLIADAYPYLVQNNNKIIFINKDIFHLGRSKDNDFIFKNTNIGRHHCKIIKSDSLYFIEDLNSKNGTYVNELRVTSNHKVILRNGDKVKLADEIFVFVNEGV